MNGHDAVDELLTRAFAAEAQRAPEGLIAGQVMARIRRRRRLRTAVLLPALGIGIAVAAMLSAPALDELGRLLGVLRLDPAILHPAALPAALPTGTALVLLLLGWFACLEEESGAL